VWARGRLRVPRLRLVGPPITRLRYAWHVLRHGVPKRACDYLEELATPTTYDVHGPRVHCNVKIATHRVIIGAGRNAELAAEDALVWTLRRLDG
jgi:hypothetical protein